MPSRCALIAGHIFLQLNDAMHYWLLKSEPSTFGIDDLAERAGQTEPWDGVRNYQARNYLKEMRLADQAFFYHSNCTPPGIAGVVEVVREAYPDPSAFDPNSRYYDPKSDPDRPTWYLVDVKLVRKLRRLIPLQELKDAAELGDFALTRRGNRLSVMPVSELQWQQILSLE